jgi:hypothetical protein
MDNSSNALQRESRMEDGRHVDDFGFITVA